MKNLKKVLALVVALTMVFTTVAFASYPDVDVEANYAGAVELLSALDILQGDENGNFNPDNTITRAEFAAVVCRALGLENSAVSAKGATMFKDVAADHWASGYINLASQQGIVNGKGNGIFDPEGNVTYAEAVKMLVVAIGYEPMAATKGGWPTGYLSVANSTKMTAGVGGAADVAALRSTVAMLTANALEIPVMAQTAYGTQTQYAPLNGEDDYTTLLTQQDIYVATGTMSEFDLIEGTFVIETTEASEDFEFAANAEVPAKIGESNVVEYEHETVDVYVKKLGRNKYEALIAVPAAISETLVINASALEESNADITAGVIRYFETVDADKSTKIYVETGAEILVNGVKLTSAVTGDEAEEILEGYNNLYTSFAGKDAEIKFINNDDDKEFDKISVTVYEHAIVKEVKAEKGRIDFLKTNSKLVVNPEDETLIANYYDADGKEIELADIKEGDVLAIVVGELKSNGEPVAARNFTEEITVYDLGASSVTGILNQADEDNGYIYIDGVAYEYNTTFVSEKDYDDLFKNDVAKLGTEGVFYLGMTGKVIGYAGVEGATGNYAFILQGAHKDSAWDACYQLKLLLADGTIATYDIDDEVIKYEGESEDTLEYAEEEQGIFEIDAWTKGEEDAHKRVIDFKTNAKDVITEITFVYLDADGANDFAQLGENATFKASTTKVDSKGLASDVVIFNVDVTDADDASVVGLDILVDEAEYEGYVLVKDERYDVFVMTAGSAKFDAEAPLFVVDSVVKTTYGEDKEAAYQVTYYVDGSNEKATAIFTSESEKYASVSLAYTTLAKGSLFVANTAADGLVDKYMVIANVDAEKEAYADLAGVAERFEATFADDDADIDYGYIGEIDGAAITIIDGAEYVVESSAAQYYFNNAGSKAKLEVGDWAGVKVDEADEDGANFVFVRLYDGDVIDIITFSERVVLE